MGWLAAGAEQEQRRGTAVVPEPSKERAAEARTRDQAVARPEIPPPRITTSRGRLPRAAASSGDTMLRTQQGLIGSDRSSCRVLKSRKYPVVVLLSTCII